VDEENLYLSTTKSEASHKAVSHSESDSDLDYEEDNGLVGKDHVLALIVAYDKEDPPMDVG
jgi:hypothetical protein